MKNLKVVFFGTPEFAKNSLEAIFHSNHKIVGVVTVADKQSGRGQKTNSSAVKKYAEEQGLKIFQPLKLRDPNFLEEIQNLEADVFVVVAFRMMPKILFEMPKLGTFNLHASLLPDYRGAAPINYAIMNGETKTGATTFFINEKIDEGNILLQESLAISPTENAGELHDRLMHLGANLIVKTLDGLAENNITEKLQPIVEHPKNAFKIFKDDTRINWNLPVESVYNFVRGLSPYPAAFTTIKINGEEKNLKIFAGTFEENNNSLIPGTLLISKKDFNISTKNGIYKPTEIQLEGKKRMSVKDFLNGFRDFENIEII
ncbi:methionyl-tRNA formyltransferase [Halpernia humi]|uniref:Methionyl-tRNA formyltransferase n=1 Tax=Halpernia humi TaxID=493375 RepID=A0A1H5X765_9FLAO|nr:methionyl-tRNA formyltransferase [Halpernia humi]SEG07227.1 methionyl-tRNA formyltransferase [Halpernia humi]